MDDYRMPNMIQNIKLFRQISGWGLREAKVEWDCCQALGPIVGPKAWLDMMAFYARKGSTWQENMAEFSRVDADTIASAREENSRLREEIADLREENARLRSIGRMAQID